MPRVVASATSAPFACAARVAGAHRAGVRMLQPMGHLRLFLPMALGKAGAVRRPPPSGHAGIGPQGDSLGCPVASSDMSVECTCRAWLACCDPARDFNNAASLKKRSLLDTQQARTRNQPHATPEGALDTTREQALTETGVPQPAVTRAAHNAAGPPRGALYSDTDREVWLTAGHTIGHTHATARRNATDGGTRLTASPTDSSDWRPAQRSLLRTPAYRPQPSRASF